MPPPTDLRIVTCKGQGGAGDIWANVWCLSDKIGFGTEAAINTAFLNFYTSFVSDGGAPLNWTLDEIKHTIYSSAPPVVTVYAQTLKQTDTQYALPSQL